ncbi:MAG: GNAT family N-acetyltransferase [Myxococcaceae bacterium]|nr:GNAT family N-acetyltransferase [Myxococcaceae bacterium]
MSTAPLRLKVLEAVSDVPKAAWNALLAPGEAPVTRWEWLDAMEQSGSAVPERGWSARHLTLWRGEQLVASLPAYLKTHSMGEYVYDFGWANAAAQFGVAYYPKLLVGMPLSPVTARKLHVAPGEDEAAVRAQLTAAALELARSEGASSVHALFPPEDEALAFEAAGFFRRGTLQFHWKNPGFRTYDDYLSRFDSKRRHQLKRERGAAAQQGLTLRTVRSAELDESHATLAARFYEATAGRYSWGPVQLTRDFFRRAFRAMPDAIELVVAQRKDRVVAGAFNLHTPTHLYGRYWGCFEEFPFLHFHVCLYHSIDDAIGRGLRVFEPGAGGEHKVSRGFEPTRVHSAHRVFHPKFEQALKRASEREAQEIDRVAAESERIAGMKPWPAS